MANSERVTVDKAYFDAVLRKANFHTSEQPLGRQDPVNVTISKAEYDSLLRMAHEFDTLRAALFQGGITSETLDLLISGPSSNDQRKNSGIAVNSWTADNLDRTASEIQDLFQPTSDSGSRLSTTGRTTRRTPAYQSTPGYASLENGNLPRPDGCLRVPSLQRHTNHGMSSLLDDTTLEDGELYDDANHTGPTHGGVLSNDVMRTLFFSGLSERTTYRDLLSVVKGGKLLSVNLRPERTGTVTFVNGAAEFLAWAKRNDIYLHAKRVDVKWADRQYHLNNHIGKKVATGATRNIVIRSADEKGLTEAQIRADMEHIHNLVIIDVTFVNGDAYVSANSVHNALFARTCMLSRSSYRGCQIEFYSDDCDVPLPMRSYKPRPMTSEPAKRKAPIRNRFDMLNIDGTDASSDEENRPPSEQDSDEHTIDASSNVGVRLDLLD